MLEILWERADGGEKKAAKGRDASLGGLFIETDKPLEEGALLSVEIADGEEKIVLEARVLTSQPDGMAVRFIDLPEEGARTLRRILAKKMPREATVLGGMEAPAPLPDRGETIHGVGGATRDGTTPGIAPPAEMIAAAIAEQEKKKEANKTLAEPVAALKK